MAAAKKKPISQTGGKETIYIDVDDEITTIIDKVKASEQKIVALVLPKRASVLQSVVNMKLLKKAGQTAKKNIVLITSETGLLPLAGAAGLHVAKSLQSKPEIPSPPPKNGDEVTEVSMEKEDEIDRSAPVGALAAAAAVSDDDDDTETIELDNMEVAPAPAAAVGKVKKLKHLKVPNFERFRLGFLLAGLALVLLIGGWIFAATVLPKAIVTIKTDTTSVVSSFDFTASVNQAELDADNQKIPAVLKETKKTDTEKVPVTGERDEGTKASGEVTLSIECSPANFGKTIQSGTAVSSGGLNFIMQQTAVLNNVGDGCILNDTVDVRAAQNGENYNLAAGKSFAVAGEPSVSATNADSLDGGTSKIVKVVAQKDIDDALTRIRERQGEAVKDELTALFETDGLFALQETLKAGEPVIKAAPEVSKEATEVTVTSEITYSMIGIKRDDLVAVIKKDIEGDIDTERQAITDDGIDAAIIRINNNTAPGEAFLSFRTSVTAGPEIDEDAIKEAIRGKKRGDAEKYISALPGVNEVVIDYSPFWVYSTPKAAKKITIVVEKVE